MPPGAVPPGWVQPGIAAPPDEGVVDGVVVDGVVAGEAVDDDPPAGAVDDDPPDDEPLDAGGAVVELLLVAAVAAPGVNSAAPTAPPARSEPTMPAAATAFRVRFMHVSFCCVVQPRDGAGPSIGCEAQAAVRRAWEVAESLGPFLRAAPA